MPLPEDMPLNLAAPIGTFALAESGLSRVPDEREIPSACVVGLGPLGVAAIELLCARKVPWVSGVDPDPLRRQRARDAGAHDTAESVKGTFALVLECSGTTNGLLSALQASEAEVLLFGEYGEEVRLDFESLRDRELDIRTVSDIGRRELEAVVDLAYTGRIDPDLLIDAQLPLASYRRAVAMIENHEGLKIVVLPQERQA